MLLLDEPLGALDLKLREEMQVELKAIQHEVGITFVFVTHDQGEALSMSDRIAVFNHGRIEQVGTPREIYEQPATAFVAGFVGTSNLLDGERPQRLLGRGGAFTVRPERIRLVAADAAASPTATIARRRHRRATSSTSAPTRRVRVALDDGGQLRRQRAERPRLAGRAGHARRPRPPGLARGHVRAVRARPPQTP